MPIPDFDLACFLAGSALPFLLGPLVFLLSWCGMATGILLLAPLTGAPPAAAPPPGWGLLVLAALAEWGCGDFMLYWTHRLFHRVPLLWRAHRLHHAPAVLTPLTGFRFWPQEHLVHISGNLLGQGFGLGVVAALAGARVPAMDLLGVNLFTLAWGTVFAHLRHSHVPLPYPRWLSFVLVSPHMHQVHHSEEVRHHDRNFGTALALWDWVFGTLYIPAREERFRFGLGAPEAAPATAAAPGAAAATPAAAEAAPVRPAA
jgi:sterol desaturase/sphingolipid hydroxylase (fatty acid hydroxylase superfamily)